MKTIQQSLRVSYIIASLFLGMTLSGCKEDPEPTFKYSYTIINTADFGITMSCQGCESITINGGETKLVKTNTLFAEYDLAATSATTLKIDFEETDTDEFTIRSYEFDVIYSVAGDASSIDVTLKNASGVTEQFQAITAPVEYRFKDFASTDLYVSAKNNTTIGFVQVQILYREKVLVGDTNLNSRGTATASATKP